jgi:putative methionine-R-sulfoxide reductase with GAF domain
VARETTPKRGFQLETFTNDVLYDSIVSLTSSALRWTGLALLALMLTSIRMGWDVPAWTLILVLLGAIGLISLTKRFGNREPDELQARLEAAEDKLDRHDSYGTNICSIMDNFQRVLAGDISGVTVGEFVERGILTTGRDVMQENGHASDLRMSVLLAEDGNFVMEWASGHDIHSQKKYRQSIAKTVSRTAYEMKVMQVWKDVTVEERGFETNPHATRQFRSMVSIPILIGDNAVGVFNVITEPADAFDVADVNYLTSLGAVIQTAVGVAVKESHAGTRCKVEPQRRSRRTSNDRLSRLSQDARGQDHAEEVRAGSQEVCPKDPQRLIRQVRRAQRYRRPRFSLSYILPPEAFLPLA